jgi:hypothetical protein
MMRDSLRCAPFDQGHSGYHHGLSHLPRATRASMVAMLREAALTPPLLRETQMESS